MVDFMQKFILQKYPNYNINRYHFKSGDVVKLGCGAIVVIKESAIEYVRAYVHVRSMRYRQFGEVKISYDDLPYYNKGDFVPADYMVNTALKWSVGDIVRLPECGITAILYEQQGFQGFYAFVMETDVPFYIHAGIYTVNPYKDYVQYG